MIELIVYPPSTNKRLINNSAFASKVDVFLRLNEIDYRTTTFNANPSKFKKGKLPVIHHNGNSICDSSDIIIYLSKEYNIDMDSHLSEKDKAIGFSLTKMLEEYFYWSVLHERWFIDKNWDKLVTIFFSNIPKLLRGFIANMVRKNTRKSAIGHGMARHTDEEVLNRGKECLKHLSSALGDHSFILGEDVTSFDCCVFSFVSNVIHSDLNPELRTEIHKYKNLLSYDERFYQLLDSKN